MFKVTDANKEQFAERGTNKLIVKINKSLFKAAKVSPKETSNKLPQVIVPEEKQEENIMFKIY